MDKPLEINLSSRTLEMLLKYAKDMVEATAGAWTEPWRANQKAAALRTLAQAEADQLRIVSKGQSDALDNLLGTTTEENKTVELKTNTGNHSITSQGQKRFSNIRKTLIGTARHLEGIEVEHHQPDPDWSASLALSVQDVSSEKLQNWWSKILAGEIQNPGQTSLRTLNVLEKMSQQDAVIFEKTSNYILCDSFLFSRDGFASNQFQPGTTINHAVIQHLLECGLVFESHEHLILPQDKVLDVFPYHSAHISIEKDVNARPNLHIPMISLTSAGRELYKITSSRIQMPYLQNFAEFLHYKNYALYLIQDFQLLPNGSTSHSSKIRVMHDKT